MPKCLFCGKKGIFLRINASGACVSCAASLQREKENEAIIYFDKLKELYLNVVEEIPVPDDPVERLSVLDQITEKQNKCSELLLLLQQCTEYEYFVKVLKENVKYNDSQKMIHLGSVMPFDIFIWTEQKDLLEQFTSKLSTDIQKIKDTWFNHSMRIRSMAQFQTTLLSIPLYEIILSESNSLRHNIYDMPDIKFTNITSKSNYNKLGNFVVLDTETTGLHASSDRIIEVSAIRFRNWKPEMLFTTLINPEKKINSFIESLTGINDDMLKDAPHFCQIIESLSSFVGTDNVVGHNLLFDIKFLFKNGYNIFLNKRKYFDTLELSRRTFSNLDNYKLDTICDYYGIRDNDSSHRSSSDSYATALLFKKIVYQRTLQF